MSSEIDKQRIYERAKIISYNMGKAVFIFKNPISGGFEVILNASFVAGNPNVNNYNEVTGKNITKYTEGNYGMLFTDNRFNAGVAENNFENLPNDKYIFSNLQQDWLWVF